MSFYLKSLQGIYKNFATLKPFKASKIYFTSVKFDKKKHFLAITETVLVSAGLLPDYVQVLRFSKTLDYG